MIKKCLKVTLCGRKLAGRRLVNVEDAIQGQPKNERTAQSVMQMATDGARALAHNGFKIPLMQNLVKRAISA